MTLAEEVPMNTEDQRQQTEARREAEEVRGGSGATQTARGKRIRDSGAQRGGGYFPNDREGYALKMLSLYSGY